MSVGANPAGITPKVAQQIAQANRTGNSTNAAKTGAPTTPAASARTAALANTSAPAAAPLPAAAPAAPAATAVGGTTAPAARGPVGTTAAPGTPVQAAPMAQAAAMAAFAPFLAMAGATAVTANSTKTRGVSGDQKDSTGDVGRTDTDQSEAQPDALQEAGTESSTDVGAATQTGGPAT